LFFAEAIDLTDLLTVFRLEEIDLGDGLVRADVSGVFQTCADDDGAARLGRCIRFFIGCNVLA